MALVTFTLSVDGVGAFNDALMCIHKFSDDVAIEIRKDEVFYGPNRKSSLWKFD